MKEMISQEFKKAVEERDLLRVRIISNVQVSSF